MIREILTKDFYYQDTITVAQQLLGKYFVRNIGSSQLIGKIVETEAYLGITDEASHSFIGPTNRNKVLFGEAGHTYVHAIHRYYCIDITTEASGKPTSVLIRALEPIKGIEVMESLRQTNNTMNLTSGPGKLCQALQINKDLNAIDVTQKNSAILIFDNQLLSDEDIIKTTRIGISKAKELPLRFYIKDNIFISRT